MKKQKTKKSWWSLRQSIPVYILILPGILYMLINNYMPMFGVLIAFKKLNFKKGIIGSPWAGLDNFKFLFASRSAFSIFRNTLCYNLVFILLSTLLGITVAILLSEIRQKMALKAYQTLILLPYLMSYVIVSYLGYAFLSGQTGFINNTLLPFFGSSAHVDFYQEPKYWPFILTFVNLWKGLGFSSVIFLSSVVGISSEYYEAAKVDGATKWQQITRITLPCLKPIVITMTILSLGRIFSSDFGLFYQLPKNSGALYDVTQTLDVYVYNMLMNNSNFALSSAASVFQSIVGCICILGANALIRKISSEDAMF